MLGKYDDLKDFFLADDTVAPFFCEGGWSLHELIAHCIAFTGPADVRISSFSIGEEAIRSFLLLTDAGCVKSLKLLLDFSIQRRKFDLVLFAQACCADIRLYPNHSKVVLLNGARNACIVSSQNLTRNPRLEAGFVATSHYIFNCFSYLFDAYFENALPLPLYGN